ncbi:type II toxin-antitoxin system RelE/ParE family toxin [Planctobacterium marinum]|uniref:Toxin n=1 Tax=Planctobacterium marinum TaxID=1631968 RepID=A0AA48HR27_9ALTE|nr:toxin ParE1 [Planctobacterium marinum]
MNRYILSNKAEEDIADIYEYSANTHSDIQAEAYLVALHEALSMLAESPNLGTSAEDIRANYFQFPVQKHMVFYKKINDNILVVRVLHQQIKYAMHFSN